MSNKKIIIKTGTLRESAKEFIDVWHRAEKGNAPHAPVEKITFKDQRLLFRTLTPKRFEILEYVHKQESISIRSLAKELDRDYSNVHQDVKILFELGLMLKDEKSGKYSVPWDVIVTEIPLSVVKKSQKKQNDPNMVHRRVSHG